jgi:DNA-binding transcriptional regulator GbsR (MarR family)
MKLKGDIKQLWSGERDKFQPLNNLDQENINLEMQIKQMALEVQQMEQKISNEEKQINDKECELLDFLAIFKNVIEFPTQDELTRRDFGKYLYLKK